MEIKISTTSRTADNRMLVGFIARSGYGTATWVGQDPRVGEIYDVEIDINETLAWGRSIFTTPANSNFIDCCGDVFRLVAEVISLSEDDCLSVMLDGGVVLLDTKGVPKDIKGSVECSAKVENVKIYPVNI